MKKSSHGLSPWIRLLQRYLTFCYKQDGNADKSTLSLELSLNSPFTYCQHDRISFQDVINQTQHDAPFIISKQGFPKGGLDERYPAPEKPSQLWVFFPLVFTVNRFQQHTNVRKLKCFETFGCVTEKGSCYILECY